VASRTEAENRSREGKRLWWIAAIVAAAVLPYLPSLRGEFVLDDVELIVKDPLAHSLAHLPQTFAKDFLHGTLGPNVIYYRPLVTASFQANYMIAGPNPFVFRLTNLLMHLAAALLVFALARRVTRSLTAAGIAAVAFAVLPAHAEAAAWVSGRTDLMSCVFTLGALVVFAGWCDEGRGFSWARAATCAALTFCALFSKENALVLPLLAAGYAWVFGCRASRADKLKWAAAFLVPLVVFMLIRRHAVHVTLVNYPAAVLGRRLLGVGMAYAAYMKMMFVPQAGRVVYDVFPIGMKYPAIALAAWLVPIGLVGLGVWFRKLLPVIAFGALWMFLTLLPVSNILPAMSPVPAERFVYLPSVGSAIMIGWLAKRMLDWRPASIRVWPAVSIAIVVWYALYCAALTVQSSQPYSSNVAWSRAVSAIDGRFFRAWAGYYFYGAGLYREAAHEYEAAIEHGPPNVGDYVRLSDARRALGQPEKAVDVLLDARARFGSSARVELSLGTAYAQAGRLLDAEAAFSRAVRLDPKSAGAWVGLGRARLRLSRYREAVSAYSYADSITELSPKDRFEFGLACEGAGLIERAAQQFRQVAAEDPRGEIGRQAVQEIARIRR